MQAWKHILVTCFLGLLGIQSLSATAVITTLPTNIQDQLIAEKMWHPGCPVVLSDLRLVKLNYYTYSGTIEPGYLIVNKEIAPNTAKIFDKLLKRKFPITHASTLISYHGNWQQAEENNVTYGFTCYLNKNGKYNNEADGKTITLNPVLNPEVIAMEPRITSSGFCRLLYFINYCKPRAYAQSIQVLPASGIFSINRSLKLAGMAESVVPIFTQYGLNKWSGHNSTGANWKKFSAP